MDELNAGAREIGGNNRGQFVLKYLNRLTPEGSSWCAGFVSWCFSQNQDGMPFEYTVGARDILRQFKNKGWSHETGSRYEQVPGDVVVWWRVRTSGWQGLVGIVYQHLDSMLYTIEGNKSQRVQGFPYVFS